MFENDKALEVLVKNFSHEEIKEMATRVLGGVGLVYDAPVHSSTRRLVQKIWESGVSGKDCHLVAFHAVIHYCLKQVSESENKNTEFRL